MPRSFRHEAPLSWNGKFLPTSGYGRLAQAIGVVTGGGMAAEGSCFRLDGLDFGIACAQIMVSEAGLSHIVCGVGYDIDDQHTFVAMSDGSVWRFLSYLQDGKLITEAYESDEVEVRDNCEDVLSVIETVKAIVVDALRRGHQLDESDSFSGYVVPDGNAAIRMACVANGRFVVRDHHGHVKGGWKFMVNASPGSTSEEVSSLLAFSPMDEEEIAEVTKEYLKEIGLEGQLFPATIGKA